MRAADAWRYTSSLLETSMKQCFYPFWTLVLVLILSSACLAQASEPPCNKIEKALDSTSSMWKITRKSRAPCQRMSYFKLQYGNASVYVFIFPGNSVDDAKKVFESLVNDPDW